MLKIILKHSTVIYDTARYEMHTTLECCLISTNYSTYLTKYYLFRFTITYHYILITHVGACAAYFAVYFSALHAVL